MDNCCHNKTCELDQLRKRQSKTLWIVLSINGVMFCLELLVGLLASSVALQADSLDMLGDTLVYGFSLYVLGRDDRWRASAALLKGSIMAMFGLGVLLQSGYKLVTGEVPEPHLMGAMSVIAFIANASCLLLLTRHKADDLNMRSTWLCSRNDLIANTSVLLAAALVALTHSLWPDVVVGVLITSIFLRSAVSILREALTALYQPVKQPSSLPGITLQPLCTAGTCLANECRCGAVALPGNQ